MPQDKSTGAAGDALGRTTAPLIAQRIGATMLGSTSNEASYEGERVVIKCAGRSNRQVGVTHRMLQGLHKVIGAFQQDDGSFKLISLPASVYKEKMRKTRSQGSSAGKVSLVSRSVFESKGQPLGVVEL
jgi:hypothetical protein